MKGYKKILGKFGEIKREFVDIYSPDWITIAAEAAVVINTSPALRTLPAYLP